MEQRRDKISNIQIVFLVSSATMGVGGLSLPRIATETAYADGGFATFITGIIALVLLFFTAKLAIKFSNDTIIEYSNKIVGNFLGKIIGLAFIIYFIVVCAVILRAFASTLKLLLLPKTPLEFILITMLLTSTYLTSNGISSIAKICELFAPAIIAVILLLIFLPIQNFKIEEFYPAFSRGAMPIIKAIPKIFPSFFGYEIILFITPFVFDKEKLLSRSMIGISIPIVIFTLLVFAATGIFGMQAISYSLYPTLEMAKYINFPGAFAERFDIFFMIFWTMGSFITLSCYYYMATLSITRWLGLINYKPFAIIIIPFIFILSIIPSDIQSTSNLASITGLAGTILTASSILLLIIATLKERYR